MEQITIFLKGGSPTLTFLLITETSQIKKTQESQILI